MMSLSISNLIIFPINKCSLWISYLKATYCFALTIKKDKKFEFLLIHSLYVIQASGL